MKIRELFETAPINPIIQLFYEFSCTQPEVKKVTRLVKNLQAQIIEKAGKECNCIVTPGNHSFTVMLSIPANELDSIQWYRYDVISVLRANLDFENNVREDEDDCYCVVSFFNGFPPQLGIINFPSINFRPMRENSSLANISKIVGNETSNVEIQECEKISESVLGLVKLAKSTCPVLLTWRGEKPKWVNTLQPYLKENKNIIAAQEELFKNGLDQYAKL